MVNNLLAVLPQALRTVIASLPERALGSLEEIRVREGRPLEIIWGSRSVFVRKDGGMTEKAEEAFQPLREDCARLLDLLTRHSLYSYEEELRRGFITVAGGHRVGLAGRTVLAEGRVKLIRDIAGFNIRIAREVKGCGAAVLPLLQDAEEKTIHHTLVVSPPQMGKTTLIRELARMVSTGEWREGPKPWPGRKVGIVDERSELAACVRGVPTFDLGPRTDVLDGCPKAEGMMMLIRSMSPDVLVVDEIGRDEDAAALQEALHAGIRVIASAHGRSMDDVRNRPALSALVSRGFFSRCVVLRKDAGRFAADVFDSSGIRLTGSPASRKDRAYG